MPREKTIKKKQRKLHWTKTEEGKEKIKKAKMERAMAKDFGNINQAAATQVSYTERVERDRMFQESQERFLRKPRELTIDINSMHLRFYFD